MQDIELARVVFAEDEREQVLTTRKNSRCHFFEEFEVGDDIVQLRLDWGDIDENGYPMLDADFYCKETREKQKLKGERRSSHHCKPLDKKGRSYSWSYQDESRNFKVTIVIRADVNETVVVRDYCDAEVVKGKTAGKD